MEASLMGCCFCCGCWPTPPSCWEGARAMGLGNILMCPLRAAAVGLLLLTEDDTVGKEVPVDDIGTSLMLWILVTGGCC